MANEIYKVSYWGVGVYNFISWGIVYLLNTVSKTYSDYESRVASDNGTFENNICLMKETRKYN